MNKKFYCADEEEGSWFDLNEVKKIIVNSMLKDGKVWEVEFIIDDGVEYKSHPIFGDLQHVINYVKSLLKSNGMLANDPHRE